MVETNRDKEMDQETKACWIRSCHQGQILCRYCKPINKSNRYRAGCDTGITKEIQQRSYNYIADPIFIRPPWKNGANVFCGFNTWPLSRVLPTAAVRRDLQSGKEVAPIKNIALKLESKSSVHNHMGQKSRRSFFGIIGGYGKSEQLPKGSTTALNKPAETRGGMRVHPFGSSPPLSSFRVRSGYFLPTGLHQKYLFRSIAILTRT